MIYGIITAAGIVIYTLGPWPSGSLDACREQATAILAQNPEKAREHDLRAWCGEYADRPALGTELAPPEHQEP